MATEGQQEHPLSIYLWIWVLLFVLSLFSYMVDYIGFEGYLRWSLILIIGLMAVEGDYTLLTRLDFFGETDFVAEH